MELTYKDSDGYTRPIKGIKLHQDKAGRFWIWSEQSESNIAIKQESVDAAMRMAVSMLLFTCELQKTELEELRAFKARFVSFIESEGYTERDEDAEAFCQSYR